MANSSKTFPVTVHLYPSITQPDRDSQAYEYVTSTQKNKNALVFIGGLGDGPHGIPYVRTLASRLSSKGWSVFEPRLTSAYSGFGHASLKEDVAEIAAFVEYLRSKETEVGREGGKVVLMGHSTGCQDCMEYATTLGGGEEGDGAKRVDGFILQGPVSDREAILMALGGDGEDDKKKVSEESVKVAERMMSEGRGQEAMPLEAIPEASGFRGSPVTAYRWWSLAGVG